MSKLTEQPLPPEVSVLSLDPGITTGWATWSEAGRLIEWGHLTENGVYYMLSDIIVKDIVYEDYRLRYGRQPAADNHHTAAQIIGACKLLSAGGLVRIWPQEVEVLTIESMHLSLKRPKTHKDGHYVDAVLHGAYWFRRFGIEPDITVLRP